MIAYPKVDEQHIRKDFCNSNTFVDTWHLLLLYLATNEKIAITHLWHAIEPQTMYHLIAKDKVAEQHILGKHSNCNSFGVTMALLNSQNFKVAITQLSKVQQV